MVIFTVRAFTSICLWDDVGDVTVRHKGKMEDVGGLVLACQWVKNLTVNPDLYVLPFGVTHLKQTHTRLHRSLSEKSTLWETKEKCFHAALCVREVISCSTKREKGSYVP